MTAISAKPARPDLHALKQALAQHQTCSDAAVQALQELLGAAGKATGAQGKENVKPRAGRTQDAKTTTRPRAKTKTKADADLHADAQPALTPREKFLLATEVVNSSLKALSDTLKTQPKSHSRVASTSRAASDAKRPPAQRALSQISNASGLVKSSSHSSAKPGAPASVVAVAECARLAFAYLRSSEAWKTSGKDMPALQLETGMLSLVGKLLSHGLDSMAAKELRVLKRRLETHLRPTKEGSGSGKGDGEQTEKETLASLLNFGEIDMASPALQLALNHQLYVLKIIGSSKRPSTIESAYEFLETSSPSSPVKILLQLADKPGNKDKAARQLESFAQMLLSLCPSISSSEDSSACNAATGLSPHVAFQLQALAFDARSKWWNLSGHQGDAQKELLEPFSKCLAAFSRRSSAPPAEKYSMASAKLKALECVTGVKARDRNVCTVMSSLAQSAGMGELAMGWIKNQAASSSGRQASDAAQAASRIRIATLSLDNQASSRETKDLDANIVSALKSLGGSLRGDSADLDALLTEVSSLRRAASRAVVDAESDPELRETCFSVVSACIHCLARYIGTAPTEGSDPQAFLRHDERLQIASKAVKGFTDSATACCKILISCESVPWDALDSTLEDCRFILREVEALHRDNSKQLHQFSANLGRPFVKLSGLYWLLFAYYRKRAPFDEALLQPIRKSVEILLDRPEEDKSSGLLLLKLEKFAEVLEEMRKYEDAEKAYFDSIRTQIGSGALKEAAEKASTGSFQQAMLEGRSANLLKTATSLHRLLLRQNQRGGEKSLYIDLDGLESAERAVLLEVQLILCCETHAKYRNPNAALTKSICDLVRMLFTIYVASQYPLRRQRVSTHVLRLGADCQDILGEELFSEAVACTIESRASIDLDTGLRQFQQHYSASHKMSIALLKCPPSTDEVQEPLRAWQSIFDGVDSWIQLTTYVDAFEAWMSQLQMVSDYLGMKGLDFLRVPVLSIMSKAMELQKPPDYGKLVQALASLGAQYARLGYSGKAGTVLAKAQGILENGEVPTEAVLQWHLAYAEYMLVLGNLGKCGEILSAARQLAESDPATSSMSMPRASFSTKLRYNRLLSEASHVYSLLSLGSGYPTEALAYAKQCVNLNRKIWLTVENRQLRNDVKEPITPDSELEEAANGVTKVPLQGPITISMTHGALTGAAFWSFVPSIFRGLTQLASVFAHQGMLQEAVYFSEQASKVAAAVEADSFIVQNLSSTAEYYLESNRVDDASQCLAKADTNAKQLSSSVDLARFHTTGAQLRQLMDDDDDAIERYDMANRIIQNLSDSDFIQNLEKLSNGEVEISNKMSNMMLEEEPAQSRKTPAKTAKAKRTTARAATKTTARKTAAAASVPEASQKTADACPALEGIQATILCRKASLFLARDCLSEAVALIEEAAQLKLGQEAAVQHQSTRFRSLMSEAMKEIAADFTFNALPESTISFPALCRGDRKLSEPSQARPSYLSIADTPSPVAPVGKRGAKGKKASKEDFAALLKRARDCIAEVQSQAVHTSSTSAVQRVCSMLNEVTILLSATTPKGAKGSLHPLYAAYLTELPKVNASKLEQEAVSIEHQTVSRETLMAWPEVADDQQRPVQLTAAEFQTDYVNVIPRGWTAVSLSLNEARDELYITRYVPYQSPFILRLPMARHNSRDMDEEIFGFEEGKAELKEIIELSDFSTRNFPDLRKKGAKTEWWAEREALDARLSDLLANIENIWLGGFRGIFKKKGDRASLSRFSKNFENILDRHLPSRQGKGTKSKTSLDWRILELFVGLGNPDDGGDLDEPLMDLVYFIVDILQFNGERNAYDEIDFDSIIIEMLDALRSFHEAAEPTPNQHTILILDKNLHAFPWESLPSLQQLSISRLPSMSALRERLLAARASKYSSMTSSSSSDEDEINATDDAQHEAGGHRIAISTLTGTSILNPGGDLVRTQETLAPHVNASPGMWHHMIGRVPDETTFETSLAKKDVLLYFGHGSGAQYVRGRTIKKLLCQRGGNSPPQSSPEFSSSPTPDEEEQQEQRPTQPLATSLLFGCSSAHVTDNGAFEPSGMLCAYLTAGVPAVLGMLWDVTDKDCDRFAIATLQKWGLFEQDEQQGGEEEEEEEVVEPKTPRRKRATSAAAKTPSKSRSRSRGRPNKKDDAAKRTNNKRRMGLDEAVARSREACYLRYLNGAAAVVYGIPVFLE